MGYAAMHKLLYSHARKSFKTNMAPWLPRGRIRAHEHERGGFSAGASGRMNQRWVNEEPSIYISRLNAQFYILGNVGKLCVFLSEFDKENSSKFVQMKK